MSELTKRIHPNFDKYLENFILYGENVEFPTNLSDDENQNINAELKSYGVWLHRTGPNTGYRFGVNKNSGTGYKKLLWLRANKEFDNYVNYFLKTGEPQGFSVGRMTDEMWNDLSASLIERGIVLHPEVHTSGQKYMVLRSLDWVRKNGNAAEKTNMKIFDDIKKFYPNVPAGNAYLISNLNTDNLVGRENFAEYEIDDAYKLLRHTRPGETLYTNESLDDFKKSRAYQLDHANRKSGVFGMNHDGWFWRGFSDQSNHILPDGRDSWHISINARLCPELLRALDQVVVQDQGRTILEYKFTDHYSAVGTRFDTISMYTRARDPELEAAIARAVAPFVRSNDGLMGDMLGKGVSIIRDTSTTDKSVGQVAADKILHHMVNLRTGREPVLGNDKVLFNKASKNFYAHLEAFLQTGANDGLLPIERLIDQDWDEINKYLKSRGVGLYPCAGGKYMAFYNLSDSLSERASKNFEKYFENFLKNGVNTGLPFERLSVSDWRKLNEELKSRGVGLKKGQGDNSAWVYFYRLPTNQNPYQRPMDGYNRL